MDTYTYTCKHCKTEHTKTRHAGKKRTQCVACYKKRCVETAHRNQIKFHYGLTFEAFNALLEKQCGKCAICQSPSPGSRNKMFTVDHDHETGRVRGLLCHGCNLALGHFKDSVEVMQAAMAYLEARR